MNMIHGSVKDTGALQALLQRFGTQRLPRMLRIKRNLDDGEKLAVGDLAFLHEVLKTAGQIKPLMDRNPDFQDFYAQSVSLFHEITTLALENEQRP